MYYTMISSTKIDNEGEKSIISYKESVFENNSQ